MVITVTYKFRVKLSAPPESVNPKISFMLVQSLPLSPRLTKINFEFSEHRYREGILPYDDSSESE